MSPKILTNNQKIKISNFPQRSKGIVLIVLQVIGGYLSDSLAIMTDAAHMLSDLGSFVVGLLAIKMGSRDAALYCNYLLPMSN